MPFLRPQAASSSRLEDDERERTALALAEPNRIDEAVVGHIEDVLWRSMRHQDDAFGPAGALETTLAQRNLVRDFCRPRLVPFARGCCQSMPTHCGSPAGCCST